jgi:hypothetical protein
VLLSKLPELILEFERNDQNRAKATMADGKKFVVLISEIACTAKQTSSQRRVETIMQAKKFDFELVDGANPNQRDR